MPTEQRILETTEVRATTSPKGKRIVGYAATYNTLSRPLPGKAAAGFRERILPGAFRSGLANKNNDPAMLVNHDPSKILGRVSAGTLRLSEDEKGLRFECDMPNTQTADDIYESIKRGDINSCSFSFGLGSTDDEQWGEEDTDEGRSQVRNIRNIPNLYDASVVTYPAYPNGTSVDARGLTPLDREIASLRQQVVRAQSRLEQKKFQADLDERALVNSMALKAYRECFMNHTAQQRRKALLDSILNS